MLQFLSILLALYLLASLLLYTKQRDILFFPTDDNSQVDAETLWITTKDANLKTWKINQGEQAIIYFGGNSEAIEANIPGFKQMFNGFTVYLVNYRGYGGSSGKPTEAGLFIDALAVYDQLKKQHKSISVVGRSLGSGVACYLASQREVTKLALTTPYDSISNVAQSHYPMFPVKWLLKDRFDSTLYAPSIKSKTLVLYAEHDRVVPVKHTLRLLEFMPEAEARQVPTTAHNDISNNAQYQNALSDFMQSK